MTSNICLVLMWLGPLVMLLVSFGRIIRVSNAADVDALRKSLRCFTSFFRDFLSTLV